MYVSCRHRYVVSDIFRLHNVADNRDQASLSSFTFLWLVTIART